MVWEKIGLSYFCALPWFATDCMAFSTSAAGKAFSTSIFFIFIEALGIENFQEGFMRFSYDFSKALEVTDINS